MKQKFDIEKTTGRAWILSCVLSAGKRRDYSGVSQAAPDWNLNLHLNRFQPTNRQSRHAGFKKFN